MRNFSFSKLIMAILAVTFFMVDIFVAYIIWRIFSAAYCIAIDTGTVSIFSTLATPISAFLTFNAGVVSVAFAFYSNKAKAENVIKIGNSTVEPMVNKEQLRDC